MSELGPRLVIDCSAVEPLEPELLERLEREALSLIRAGDLEKAQNVTDQIAAHQEAAAASGPREQEVELDDDERAQREADAADGRERQMTQLRAARDARLSASDWTQGIDAPLDHKQVAAWGRYRQDLRDWPKSVEDPHNPPPWPDPPTGG